MVAARQVDVRDDDEDAAPFLGLDAPDAVDVVGVVARVVGRADDAVELTHVLPAVVVWLDKGVWGCVGGWVEGCGG